MKRKLLKKIILPASGLLGHKTRKYYKEYINMDFKPIDLRRKTQFKRLKKIIEHAYKNVIFYKEKFDNAGISPDDITSLNDIKKIPITTKRQLRNNFPDKLIAKNYKGKVRYTNTSGTTGRPTFLAQDKGDINRKYAAKLRSRYLYNASDDCSVLRITPNQCQPVRTEGSNFDNYKNYLSEFVKNPKNSSYAFVEKLVKKLLHGKKKLPPIAKDKIDKDINIDLKSKIKLINKFEPDVLSIYPLYCYWLAKFIENNGLKAPHVGCIDFTGGLSTGKMRKTIEEIFNTRTFQNYGGCEFGRYASECNVKNHNMMHILEEHCYVEFVKANGDYASEREPANIITTSLSNRGMPLIRIEHGDVGWYVNKKCDCGRTSRMMNVEGRIQSILFNQKGKKITAKKIYDIMHKIEGVDYFQMIQKKEDILQLNIVNNNSNIDKNKIKQGFNILFDKNTKINIVTVDHIDCENSNKYMLVKSNTYNKFRPIDVKNETPEIN